LKSQSPIAGIIQRPPSGRAGVRFEQTIETQMIIHDSAKQSRGSLTGAKTFNKSGR
jgi:hypothetical protein